MSLYEGYGRCKTRTERILTSTVSSIHRISPCSPSATNACSRAAAGHACSTDPDMTTQEKRAILASWASDACAVEAAPDLRQAPSAQLVRFDDIMDALKRLDGEAAGKPNYRKLINRADRWKDLYRANRGGRCLREVRP